MGDLADVLFPRLGCEEDALGQMKVPVLFESQVRLVGILQFLFPLHELDGDVRGVEATQVTDQDIFLTKFAWMTAVHLNLGCSYSQMKRGPESVRVFRAFQCTKPYLFYFILFYLNSTLMSRFHWVCIKKKI